MKASAAGHALSQGLLRIALGWTLVAAVAVGIAATPACGAHDAPQAPPPETDGDLIEFEAGGVDPIPACPDVGPDRFVDSATDAPADGPPDPACAYATTPRTFAEIAHLVTCGGELCHSGWTHDELVGRPSYECCGTRLLVEPFAPSRSYLLSKLRGVDMCGGARIPIHGPYLEGEKLQQLTDWICAGAPAR